MTKLILMIILLRKKVGDVTATGYNCNRTLFNIIILTIYIFLVYLWEKLMLIKVRKPENTYDLKKCSSSKQIEKQFIFLNIFFMTWFT